MSAAANPQVTAEQLAAAMAALAQRGLLDGLPNAALTPVAGGTSGRTFQLLDAAGVPQWTVRFARPGGGDRLAWEAQVLQELHTALTLSPESSSASDLSVLFAAETNASQADLHVIPAPPHPAAPPPAASTLLPAEPLLLEDSHLPEGCLLLHRHVPGAPRDLLAVAPAELTQLGQGLGWLHEQQRNGYAIWPDYREHPGTRADAVRARIASLDAWRHADDPTADALVAALHELPLDPQAGWQETSFALLHGDLSPGNILWSADDDGADTAHAQAHLIDWEYARAGDPAEELAYLISEAGLSAEQFEALAEGWLEVHDDPWALARLPVWLPFVAVDSALWWHDYARKHPHLDVREQIAERDAVAQRVLAGGLP